jgi:hypothetical protein
MRLVHASCYIYFLFFSSAIYTSNIQLSVMYRANDFCACLRNSHGVEQFDHPHQLGQKLSRAYATLMVQSCTRTWASGRFPFSFQKQ